MDIRWRDEVDRYMFLMYEFYSDQSWREGGAIVLAFVRFHNPLMRFFECIPRKAGLVKINCTQMESNRTGMHCICFHMHSCALMTW